MPRQRLDSEVQGYLTTLRRIPDDVILDMAVNDLNLYDGQTCVVGWALRATLAKKLGRKHSDDVTYDDYADTDVYEYRHLPALLGGTVYEWKRVYCGVADSGRLPDIELAFVLRLDEAVAATKQTRRAR